ncbi:MAG: hypothetical protein V1698_01000 [bacterium]
MEKMTIQKIRNRFEIIKNEISQLVKDKYYFEKYQEHIERSKNVNKSNDFLFFIAKNYQVLAVVNVCKQVEGIKKRTKNNKNKNKNKNNNKNKKNEAESLVNLLQDIKKNKNIFHLNKFIKKYPKQMEYIAVVDFKQFSINNKLLSCQKINEDINKIRKAIRGLRFGTKRQSIVSLAKYRNKRGAHFEKGKPKINVHVQDLYNAIDLLEQLVIKYNSLINQSKIISLLTIEDENIQVDEIFKD